MRVIVKRCELLCIFSDNRHFFDLTLSQKDANYEKMSMVSRGLTRIIIKYLEDFVNKDKLSSRCRAILVNVFTKDCRDATQHSSVVFNLMTIFS